MTLDELYQSAAKNPELIDSYIKGYEDLRIRQIKKADNITYDEIGIKFELIERHRNMVLALVRSSEKIKINEKIDSIIKMLKQIKGGL